LEPTLLTLCDLDLSVFQKTKQQGVIAGLHRARRIKSNSPVRGLHFTFNIHEVIEVNFLDLPFVYGRKKLKVWNVPDRLFCASGAYDTEEKEQEEESVFHRL